MNRYKDHRIEPLGLSERELKDLEAFLLSLTDMTVLDRAEWSDPGVEGLTSGLCN